MEHLLIGSDHGGYELKELIKEGLQSVTWIDTGCNTDDSCDYPSIVDNLVKQLKTGTVNKGILICGTGIGVSMRANRYKGIRAALVYDQYTAEMAKAHNNANILCLGGRITLPKVALKLVEIWLKTPFDNGRHELRCDMIDYKLS